MPVSVHANQVSIVHKATGSVVPSFPDVCHTPQGSGAPVPIPYPTTGAASGSAKEAPKVTTAGSAAHVVGSKVQLSQGDEAGTTGGMVSSTVKSPSYVMYGFDVKVEGVNVVRHVGLTSHNQSGAASAISWEKVQELRSHLAMVHGQLMTMRGTDRTRWHALVEEYVVTAAALYLSLINR